MDFKERHKKKKGAKSEMCNNHLAIMLKGFILRTQYFYLGGGEGSGVGKDSAKCSEHVICKTQLTS